MSKEQKASYLGNSKLKPAGVKINFQQEHVEELIKCANDPKYFMEKYGKIVTLDKGLSNVTLYPYQEKILNIVEKERFFIGKLPRQSGKCVAGETKIKVRRKGDLDECEMTIQEFHEIVKKERENG